MPHKRNNYQLEQEEEEKKKKNHALNFKTKSKLWENLLQHSMKACQPGGWESLISRSVHGDHFSLIWNEFQLCLVFLFFFSNTWFSHQTHHWDYTKEDITLSFSIENTFCADHQIYAKIWLSYLIIFWLILCFRNGHFSHWNTILDS